MIPKVKAVLIGPVYPYRGGISHYHTLLANKLTERHEIRVISFKRLYPEMFYPGKSQKEENKNLTMAFTVDYDLDSVNPHTWFSVYNKIKEYNPEWVIFQWWHTFFAPCYGTIAYLLKKNTPIKTALAFHNFVPHDAHYGIHLFLLKCVARYTDYLIALYSSVEKEIKEAFPDKKCGLLQGPSCAEMITVPKNLTQQEARTRLKVKGKVILFFGFVRPYKGLTYLLDALAIATKEVPITLLIAGEFWGDQEKYLQQINTLGLQKKVIIYDRYIPNEEVPFYFKAADVVVTPYTATSDNSAVLNLALGLGIPVIASRVGSNEDLIEHNKNGYLVEPRNTGELAKAIITFFKKNKAPQFKKAIASTMKQLTWSEEKEKILFALSSSATT